MKGKFGHLTNVSYVFIALLILSNKLFFLNKFDLIQYHLSTVYICNIHQNGCIHEEPFIRAYLEIPRQIFLVLTGSSQCIMKNDITNLPILTLQDQLMLIYVHINMCSLLINYYKISSRLSKYSEKSAPEFLKEIFPWYYMYSYVFSRLKYQTSQQYRPSQNERFFFSISCPEHRYYDK